MQELSKCRRDLCSTLPQEFKEKHKKLQSWKKVVEAQKLDWAATIEGQEISQNKLKWDMQWL